MTFNAPLAAFPGFFTRGCVLGNHRKPSRRGALAQGRTVAIHAAAEVLFNASYIRHRSHRRRDRRRDRCHRFASFAARITPI